MPDRIMTAEARIVAKDLTGGAFSAVASKAQAMAKTISRVNAVANSVGPKVGALDRVSGVARRLDSIERLTAVRQRLAAMERSAIAAAGGGLERVAGFAAPAAMAYGAKKLVEQGAHLQHERLRMEASGMAKEEIAEANKQAVELAAKMPQFDQTTILHMLRNMRSVVGTYEEAGHIIEPLLKLRTIAQAAKPGQDVSEDFDQLVKGLEIKGATQHRGDFLRYMDGIAKGLNIYGDTLKPNQYYEMFKYGRQATPGLSEKFILSTAPALAQELGGSSYGKAVSAFNSAIVGGVMKHAAAKEFARLKLIDEDDIERTKTGSIKGLKPGRGVRGWQLAQSDPNEWIKTYLMPALKGAGIVDPQKVMKTISSLFQAQTAAQLVSLLATQQSRIEKNEHLYNQAQGLGAADAFRTRDFGVAVDGLKHSIANLAQEIGQPFADLLTPAINSASDALGEWTKRMHLDREAREKGEETPSAKKFRRAANRAVFGVDTDGIADDALAEKRRLDAIRGFEEAYRRRSDALLRAAPDLEEQDKAERRLAQLGAVGGADRTAAIEAEFRALKEKVEGWRRISAQIAELENQRDSFYDLGRKATSLEQRRRLLKMLEPSVGGIAPGEERDRIAPGPGKFGFGPAGQGFGGGVAPAAPQYGAPGQRSDSFPVDLRNLKARVEQPIPVDVSGKVQLEGQAQVSVRVAVDGPAKVSGMGSTSSGHIKANVGTSMGPNPQ